MVCRLSRIHRVLLSAFVCASAVSCSSPVARIDASLSAASRFMVARQSPDGAWRSGVYGFFKDGPSLTPHVASCLFFMPDSRPAFDRSVAYMAGMLDEKGQVRADFDVIYPVYTAGESSRMVVKGGRTPEHLRAQQAWLAYLCAHQMTEDLGWRRTDLEYGGWGFAHEPPRKPVAGGFRGPWDWSNLSTTVYALGALRSARVEAGDARYAKALVFIQRCQNFADDPARADWRFDDGGFFFTPCTAMHNKAGVAGKDRRGRIRFHSYGSMTADGLRGLIACGLPPDHPRVQAARAWLARNFAVDHNPGTFVAETEDLRDASYYYYCWSLAHAMMHTGERRITTPGGRVDWAKALAEELLRRQRPDGSWRNGFTDGKEDDPLVATPFAASALAICREVIAGTGTEPARPCRNIARAGR